MDDAPRVAWGGDAFHAPCGNLWFNLSALTRSPAASTTTAAPPTAAPVSIISAAGATGDDDDDFGGFAGA